jgi:hypothetical protein
MKNYTFNFLVTVAAGTLGLGALADAQASFDWIIEEVDGGTKPALALNSQGKPYITYMLERRDGWSKVARQTETGWEIDTIDTGYFYGPPDITVTAHDVPQIFYHDHWAQVLNPSRGNAVRIFLSDGVWTKQILEHPGHDGWDTRAVVDAQGNIHLSAIDPIEFGGKGVEYYLIEPDKTYVVDEIGTGAISYRYATAIGVDPGGFVSISYFDQPARNLMVARRDLSGEWDLELVDDGANAGMFSSLAVDANGGVHVSYFQQMDGSSGEVKYAHRPPGGGWVTSTVDRLDRVVMGFAGARNLTSMALDTQGNPWIAYSDEEVVRLAIKQDSSWSLQTVEVADILPLAQIVSLKLDPGNMPHLAFGTVTSGGRMLDGFVFYARGQRTATLELRNPLLREDQFRFSFAASPEFRYRVEFRDNIDADGWILLHEIEGADGEQEITVGIQETTRSFFRVQFQ